MFRPDYELVRGEATAPDGTCWTLTSDSFVLLAEPAPRAAGELPPILTTATAMLLATAPTSEVDLVALRAWFTTVTEGEAVYAGKRPCRVAGALVDAHLLERVLDGTPGPRVGIACVSLRDHVCLAVFAAPRRLMLAALREHDTLEPSAGWPIFGDAAAVAAERAAAAVRRTEVNARRAAEHLVRSDAALAHATQAHRDADHAREDALVALRAALRPLTCEARARITADFAGRFDL